jgi:hypothetical protein
LSVKGQKGVGVVRKMRWYKGMRQKEEGRGDQQQKWRECFEQQEFYYYNLTLEEEHSLCPEEKGREYRRSGPGLSLSVGGISRLGSITRG